MVESAQPDADCGGEDEGVTLALTTDGQGSIAVQLAPPAVACREREECAMTAARASPSGLPLHALNALLKRLIQDPGQGWGVLFSDYEVIMTLERYAEYAQQPLEHPNISWELFIGTALHLLNR